MDELQTKFNTDKVQLCFQCQPAQTVPAVPLESNKFIKKEGISGAFTL